MVHLKSLFVSFMGFSVSTALAAVYQEIKSFGPNPTGTQMFVYKPDRLSSSRPPVVVGIHWCSGNAAAYFAGAGSILADKYGFIGIYPNAPASNGCWDVHTNETLKHDGGGDSLGIASMVRYAISTWNADPKRIYVTGVSSGAMMTNVLLGSYPDLFAAGSAFAGVPHSCFAGVDTWNGACAEGKVIKTPAQWGDLVRGAHPGYTGARPRLQVWHGTEDAVLRYQNFQEEIKQWTNVHGLSQTPTTTSLNNPLPNYTKTTYGNMFEAYSAFGTGHDIQSRADDAFAFFGLTAPLPPLSSVVPPTSTKAVPSSSVPVSASVTATSAAPTGTGAPHWGQCGGRSWTGAIRCEPPWVCVMQNEYFSQCL